MPNPKRENFVIFLILFIIGTAGFISSFFIPSGGSLGFGADFMPKIVSGLLIFCSICFLIQSIRAPKAEKKEKEVKRDYTSIIRFGIALGLLLLYVALFKPLGFIISTSLYIFSQSLLMVPKEKKSYLKSALLAIIVSVVVYFIFTKGLNMVLPVGFLEHIL